MRKIALSLVVVAASGAYVWSQSGNALSNDPLGPLPPLGPQSALGPESKLGSEQRTDPVQTGSIANRSPVLVNAPAPTATVRLQPAVENEWSEGGENEWDGGRRFAARSLGDTPSSPDSPVPTAMVSPPVTPAPETPSPQSPVTDALVAGPAAPTETAAQPSTPTAPDPAPALPPGVVEARLPRPRPDYKPPAVTASMASTPVLNVPATRVAMNFSQGGRFVDGTYTGSVVDAYYGLVQIQVLVQSGQLVDVNVLRYPSDRRLSVRINRYALPILRREAIIAQSANVNIVSGATLTSEAFLRSLGSALRVAGA